MGRCEGTHSVTNVSCSARAKAGSHLCLSCESLAFEQGFLFALWMDEVTWEVEALCGLPPSDLPDCPYHDWYDAGMTPRETAEDVLQRCLE